ncbi:MAG TPA: hypothetical protein VMI94_04570 [Bryobacteraceae bacterium]|nr:hypothetical protein [Bryobacteraceae bacterium]
MKSAAWFTAVAPLTAVLLTSAAAWAVPKPVSFRLASLPASVEPGQKLLLCATNIGTGAVDVSLEFINVATGGPMAEKTITLQPLGGGAAATPCVTMTADSAAGAQSGSRRPMASSFVAAAPGNGAANGQTLVVGVAMIRKAWYSLREAQVTASIQVQAPDADGVMHTVQTIPLSRTAHPTDGAPVYAPAASSGGHHK